ncbi:hypothetical protein D3C83_26800 [compost metagenome]
MNLLLAQSGIGKHAALTGNKTEVKIGAVTANFIHQFAPHELDAITHFAEFHFPLRA